MDAVAEPGERGTLEITPETLTSPVAIALVAALNAELSARYPEPGATHFRLDPGEVAPGSGIFLGIGRALLTRLEAEARALGLARLVLETGTRQAEALALYRRAEFTEIPAYGEYAASPGTSVCLAKVL